jgi:serine/threonine protein kinase
VQNGIPQHIANYDVERRLGRGAMGTVYLARDRELGRHVAIKLIQADVDSPDMRERFNREARSIAALNHPNIVTLYHAGQEDTLPYLVLEYIDGRSVQQMIAQRDPVPLPQRLLWIEQLCEGLQYAHERGIIHRDIKPANLMIDHLVRLRILDFGIARIFGESRTQMSTLIGTPAYMAPEYIRGDGIDARADVFAAGAVAYELVSYERAFSGDTQSTIMHRVLSEMPRRFVESGVGELDPELEGIVFRALSKAPESRFQTAREFAAAIRTVRTRVEASPLALATPGTTVEPVAMDGTDATAQRSWLGIGPRRGTDAAPDPSSFAPTQVVGLPQAADLRQGDSSVARDEQPAVYDGTIVSNLGRSSTVVADLPQEPSSETSSAATTSTSSNTWRYVSIAASVLIVPAVLYAALTYFNSTTSDTGGGPTATIGEATPKDPTPIADPPVARVDPPKIADGTTAPTGSKDGTGTNALEKAGTGLTVPTSAGTQPEVTRTAYELFNASGGPTLPGLVYRILQRTSGTDSVVSVDPRETVFRTGRDQFRFAFRSNMDGYLYVAQKSDQGDWDVVFPEPGVNDGSNRVQKNQDYVAPGAGHWFQLDPPSGTDQVFVFLSKTPVGVFNDLNRPVTSQATLAQSEIDKLTSTISMRKLVVAKGDAPAAALGTGGSAVYVVNADAFASAVMVTFDMTHK